MKYLDRVSEAYEGLMGETLKEKTRQRMNWICEQVLGNTVLDIGCSQGICDILLGRQGFQVTGIDIAQESVVYAREMLDKEAYEVKAVIQFICADFLTEVNTDKKYDTVLMTEILEHLHEPEEMVAKAAECLRDGGRMIVTVPFGINDFPDHKHTFYAADVQNMLSKWINLESVEFLGGWVGFYGTRTNVPEPFTEVDAAFLKREEEAFYLLERPLRDQLNQTAANYKKAAEDYQTAKTWVADRDRRIAHLVEETSRLGEEKSQLQNQLAQETARYKKAAEDYQTAKTWVADRDRRIAQLVQQKLQLEEERTQLEEQKAQLIARLQRNMAELEREQAFLVTVKQYAQQMNDQLYLARRQNKAYEEKLQRIYGTWYGKIALKAYQFLRMIKRAVIHH